METYPQQIHLRTVYIIFSDMVYHIIVEHT